MSQPVSNFHGDSVYLDTMSFYTHIRSEVDSQETCRVFKTLQV